MGHRLPKAGLAVLSSVSCLAMTTVATTAVADVVLHSFDISSQPLATAVVAYSRQSGVPVLAPMELMRGKIAPPVRGRLSAEAALTQLLAGSGLRSVRGPKGGFALVRTGAAVIQGGSGEAPLLREDEAGQGAAAGAGAKLEPEEITVTGTRVRGGHAASPLIVRDQEEMRNAGHSDLGTVIRSIPQNFTGGQNPGVWRGVSLAGERNNNVTASSSINLRGLGPDATVTLLNGRRLSYDGINQAIDISVIPLEAVERLEIVADGASAIYGSDAVAGVANVLLKRDYKGLSTTARLGATSDGGGTQQQFSLVGGSRWAGGGFIAAYNFQRDEPIYASERSSLEHMQDPFTINPYLKAHSILLSGHQEIAPVAQLSVDSLYNKRWSRDVITTFPLQNRTWVESESYAISATLEADIVPNWTFFLNGSASGNSSNLRSSNILLPDTPYDEEDTCMCNHSLSSELGAEGSLFRMPGGNVRLAVGGGYRENAQKVISRTFDTIRTGKQEVAHLYGELSVPIISPSMSVALMNKLYLSGAIRHDKYQNRYSATTPKAGVVYSPLEGIDVKASWGKAFKAPTISQEFRPVSASNYPIAHWEDTGFPSSSTVLLIEGGGRLSPERAQTLTLGLHMRPKALPGFTLEVSYFKVLYRGRIITPITNVFKALASPQYIDFITFDPTHNLQAELISLDGSGLSSPYVPYDPRKVVAVIDNRLTNVMRQDVQGVDLSLGYTSGLGDGNVSAQADVSWMKSSQVNNTEAGNLQLAGTIFNPPTWRARGGVTWGGQHGSLSGFVNYVGSLKNTLVSPNATISNSYSFDVVGRYRPSWGDQNTEISLSLHNILNQKPPRAEIHPLFHNFDPTNHSAIGRTISLSVRKNW